MSGGFSGEYGLYEAIDYTPSRLPPGRSSVTVRSFMSHHQGMAFLSLDYVLHDRPMQRRFLAEPAFQATELLLQEKVPRVRAVEPHPAEGAATGARQAEPESHLRVFPTPSTPSPEVHLLSNGRYHVAVTNAGGGYSRWRDLSITRWREDGARDDWGSFCYVLRSGRRPLLVRDPPADAETGRELRGDLHAGARGVPASRRRSPRHARRSRSRPRTTSRSGA